VIPRGHSVSENVTGLWPISGRLSAAIIRLWRTFRVWRQRNTRARQLHLRETLSFGERRFVAVVEFDQRQFLIGGTGTSISLLAELTAPGDNPERAADKERAARGAA
jgi:flagellar biogenesis protein FliO